jgi:hypothetical protein
VLATHSAEDLSRSPVSVRDQRIHLVLGKVQRREVLDFGNDEPVFRVQ